MNYNYRKKINSVLNKNIENNITYTINVIKNNNTINNIIRELSYKHL